MPRDLRILVTGGGTGGHTVPAFATIDAIKSLLSEKYVDIRPIFLYVGSQAGLESRIAVEAKVDFVSIATGKLRRSSNPLKMLNISNLRDACKVPIGFLQAIKIVRKFKPDVVFSTGGYVSVPAVFAANVLKKPVLMHEQTVQIGLANRWSAKVAQRVALSYAESANELPVETRKKTFVTGGVVREIVVHGDASKARARFNFGGPLADLPIVYVTGGAQGSALINQAILDSLPDLLQKCCIIHQCGRQKSATVQDEVRLLSARANLPAELQRRYAVSAFIGDEIGDVYAACSLIVGRSGAGTVSEACAVGRAALLIPLVPTGGDEQTKNAQRLEKIGAAETIKQSELTGAVLLTKVTKLLSEPEHLKQMGESARSLASPNAAFTLAKAIVDLGLNN